MRWSTIALVAVAASLAACTSSAPDDVGGAAPGGEAPAAPVAGSGPVSPAPVDPPDGIARVQGCEPRSLLPSDASRRCGQQVLEGLFTPLVELDPVNSAPRWGGDTDRAVADTITSIDARRWVVELEEGWQFHDGTPVTAESFVDAWNFAAYGPNGQANAFLFEPIVGFDDLHCPEPGCEPSAATLEGLRVVDELTFEVVLRTPDRSLPRRLGHVAFSPLPPSALEDPEAFGEAPVGNGPFRMEGAWAHEERISLRAVEDHPVPAAADGVDVLLYGDAAAAWDAMQSGRLDVVTAVPPARRQAARDQLEWVARSGDDYEALVVPSYRPRLAEDDRLAVALSQATNRGALIANRLDGTARPARGLVPPAVSDEADRCGARCRFDPGAARALLAEVGLPPGGIELWYDRDGGHAAWVPAVADQWRRHLGLSREQVRVRSLPHSAWVSHLQDQRMGGLYPTGWSLDVASPREYLEELHGPGGLFNFDRYLGEGVAPLLREAATAEDDREARGVYRELEQVVLADMHHVPLWVRTHEAFHTPRVDDVELDGEGLVRLDQLTVAEPA